jgi:hypothetical protein
MTNTPLTAEQLDEYEAAIAAYQQHAPTGFACCSAHPVADAGAALVAEVRRLHDALADAEVEKAKLIRWHGEDETALAKMRATIEQLRGDKRELGELAARRESELIALRARVRELERPTIEAQRAEVRDSYLQLAAQCREDRDHEGAFEVDCRLRDREEQWKAEDAARPAPAAGS